MIAAPPGAGLIAVNPTTGTSIFNEIRQVGSGDYQYYRQPNGWIDFGQIGKTRSYEKQYMTGGYQPLGGPMAAILGNADYGVFDLQPYYLQHPHEVLFQRGGAHELPAEQVIALGYHLNPPLIPRCGLQVGAEHKAASGGMSRNGLHLGVCWAGAQSAQFPQLAGRKAEEPGACPFCDRANFPAAPARTQHIRVMHRDDMREMSLADAIVRGVQIAQGPAAVQPPQSAEEVEARRLAEEAAISLKMRAMGLLSDEPDDLSEKLLAQSQGDEDVATPPAKRTVIRKGRKPHRK